MKTISIRSSELIRLSGRFDETDACFPMLWSGAAAEMKIEAQTLEVQIACNYTSMPPYLSFTVDGLRSQQFVPVKGKHWYTVFCGLANAAHLVRIAKETQPFGGDTDAFVNLHAIRTDGRLLPMNAPRRKIEFIGDSITSGEGCKGPRSFMEWVPMVFSSSDTYAAITARKLSSQFHVISQSGWGVLGAWDNNPDGSIPRVYSKICGPVNAGNGQKEYDFSFKPDQIVIALGTNDAGAMHNLPHTDPATGQTYQLTESPDDCMRLSDACLSFIRTLHALNPSASLYWIVFFNNGPVHDAVKSAVEKAISENIPIRFSVPLTLDGIKKADLGSRAHPGIKAHEKIARALIKLLNE